MMNKISYLLLRLAVGTSMFGHGLVRLPKLASFSNWMMASFQKSILPTALVLPFSYALPVLEFIVGLLLLLGFFLRQTLIAGALVLVMLIFGTCMIENWEAIPSQLIHIAFLAILLQFTPVNNYQILKNQVS